MTSTVASSYSAMSGVGGQTPAASGVSGEEGDAATAAAAAENMSGAHAIAVPAALPRAAPPPPPRRPPPPATTAAAALPPPPAGRPLRSCGGGVETFTAGGTRAASAVDWATSTATVSGGERWWLGGEHGTRSRSRGGGPSRGRRSMLGASRGTRSRCACAARGALAQLDSISC